MQREREDYYKWRIIFPDDRVVPAGVREIMAWFSDWQSFISLLAAAKSGEAATMTMHMRDGGERVETRVLHHSRTNSRSTFANPLGLSTASAGLRQSES